LLIVLIVLIKLILSVKYTLQSKLRRLEDLSGFETERMEHHFFALILYLPLPLQQGDWQQSLLAANYPAFSIEVSGFCEKDTKLEVQVRMHSSTVRLSFATRVDTTRNQTPPPPPSQMIVPRHQLH